jgi:hypothetical protein
VTTPAACSEVLESGKEAVSQKGSETKSAVEQNIEKVKVCDTLRTLPQWHAVG